MIEIVHGLDQIVALKALVAQEEIVQRISRGKRSCGGTTAFRIRRGTVAHLGQVIGPTQVIGTGQRLEASGPIEQSQSGVGLLVGYLSGQWFGRRLGPEQQHLVATRHQGRLFGRAEIDRKSTRLNSSHQIISYAVFCLKKKKKSPSANQRCSSR